MKKNNFNQFNGYNSFGGYDSNTNQSKQSKEQNFGKSEDEVAKKVEDYSKMSSEGLVSELVKTAREEKKKGTFSLVELDNFYKMTEGMLNAQQRENLKKLIAELKEDI